jgi:hypothetical protein
VEVRWSAGAGCGLVEEGRRSVLREEESRVGRLRCSSLRLGHPRVDQDDRDGRLAVIACLLHLFDGLDGGRESKKYSAWRRPTANNPRVSCPGEGEKQDCKRPKGHF